MEKKHFGNQRLDEFKQSREDFAIKFVKYLRENLWIYNENKNSYWRWEIGVGMVWKTDRELIEEYDRADFERLEKRCTELEALTKQTGTNPHVSGSVLPTEGELKVRLDELPYTKHLDDGQYNDGQAYGFECGVRWVMDYVKGKTDRQAAGASGAVDTVEGSDGRPSKMYRLMIYFAHSTIVMHSKTLVDNDKMSPHDFYEANKPVMERVFDEGLSIMEYELSYEQMMRACYSYLSSKY